MSDILWGGSGVHSLDYKKQKAKRLAQKLFSTEGKRVKAKRLEDKRLFGTTTDTGREAMRSNLGKVLSARRAGKVYAETLKRELKHFFPNLSKKVQRQYVAKKMKGIGESVKDKRKEIGIE